MTQQLPSYGGIFSYTGQENASIGARFGAYLLDSLILGGASLVLYLVMFFSAFSSTSSSAGYYVGVVIFLVGSIALAIYYWVLLSRGQTPGMKATGVRLVRVQPGMDIDARGPGFGVVVGRNIIFSLSTYVIIGPLSPLFDGTGTNRGWHDKASGTWMINSRTDAAARVFGPGAGPAAAAYPVYPAGAAPLLPPPPVPPAPQVLPVLPVPQPFGRRPLPDPDSFLVESGSHRVETASNLVLSEPQLETVIAPLRGVGPVPVPPPLIALPPAPPVPSTAGIISAVPGFAVPLTPAIPLSPASPHQDPDLDETRAVAPRAQWTLRLDTGEPIEVAGLGLLGRNPAAPDEKPAQLVPFADDTKSISKTHLSFGVDDNRLWVRDRRSTNGTVLMRSGQADIPVGTDHRTFVEAGDTLALGDRRITVETR